MIGNQVGHDGPDVRVATNDRTASLFELDKIRYAIAPQMRVYDSMRPGPWMPLVMRCGHMNFRSSVVNTDRFGIRHTTTRRHGAICLERSPDESLSLLVGGSTAFGVGSTSDATTMAACLSDGTGQVWMNVGIRTWTLNQCLAFCFMHADLLRRTTRIVLCAGLNELAVVLQNARVPRRYGAFYGWHVLDSALNRDAQSDAGDAVVANRPSADEPKTRELLLESTDCALGGWRVLANGLGAKLCFALQPFASWCDRVQSVEEHTLFRLLNAMDTNTFIGIQRVIEAAHEWWASRLAAMCDKYAIGFVDCNERFSAAGSTGEWCFVDRAHLTDRGYRLCASAIGGL